MLIENDVLLEFVLRYPLNSLRAFHFQQISIAQGGKRQGYASL